MIFYTTKKISVRSDIHDWKYQKWIYKIMGKMADSVEYLAKGLSNPKIRITFGVIGGLFCIGCLATGIMEVKCVY